MINEMNAIRSMDHLASYAMRKDLSPPACFLHSVRGTRGQRAAQASVSGGTKSRHRPGTGG